MVNTIQYEILPCETSDEDLINEKINEYANLKALAEPHTEEEWLVFKITDDEGHIIAGCKVNVYAWGRAVLAELWVDERYRRQGLGSMLICTAEHAVREKGCYYLCLGTTDFQARPLYEKHGFQVFTVNKDVPKGHKSWSLSKRLDKTVPDYIPKNNSAAKRYNVEPGSKEDAEIIDDGLERYCNQYVQNEHEYVTLSKKLVDKDGNLIAGIIAGVDSDDNGDIEGIWVEEPYRNQGLGSYLLREFERDAKENSAYVILLGVCDWSVDFFLKNGYSVRGKLADYPKGHDAYELEKRL